MSFQPGLRGSNDLRVGRKMATFQLFFQSGQAKDLSAPLYVQSLGLSLCISEIIIIYVSIYKVCLWHHDLLNYHSDLLKLDIFRKIMIQHWWQYPVCLLIKVFLIKTNVENLQCCPLPETVRSVWVCVCVGFVMCGCFGNMCTCIYCVLYCLYCVFCIVSFMFCLY